MNSLARELVSDPELWISNNTKIQIIPGVPQKAERSIFVTLTLENIAYFDFIR